MITIQNTNINVTVQGQGQAVVLLHGWGQNQYMMKFLQDDLCDHYQVMNLDLPGFGESSEPDHVWDLNDYVTCIHECIEAYQMEKPILIAHSFGARIALRYAMQYEVSKMLLTGAAGIMKKRDITYYMRVYSYKLLKKVHIKNALGSPDYQQASPIMRGVLVKTVNDNLQHELKNITCEVLLVWGEKDEQTPLWMGKVMEKEITNATLIVLDKGDHFAYFHQSQRFLRIVHAYLEG